MRVMNGWKIALAGVCLLGAASAARAQATPEEELAALKAEIQRAVTVLKAQEQTIAALQERLAALEQAKAAPAAPALVAQAAAPAPAGDKKAPAISWKEGKTTFKFDSALLTVGNNVQVRATYGDYGSSKLTDQRAIRIRRFETKLSGWAYSPQLEFELELDWTRDKVLKAAFVAYDFTGGGKHFVLTGGQFKPPWCRQELDSAGKLMFTDRSLVSVLFSKGEDEGVMVSGQFGPEETPDLVTWGAGVFNGNGVYNWENTDGHMQYNARVVVNPWGGLNKDEAPPMGTDRPLLSIGAGVERNDTRAWSATGAPTSGEEYDAWGLDFAFQYGRFAVYGEHFDREATTVALVDRTDRGTVGEAGWLFVPGRFQMGVRWGEYTRRWPTFSEGMEEKGIVANVFFNRHANKLVADLRWLDDKRFGLEDRVLRVQYQLWF